MTGLLKTGPEWADGTAIRYALSRRWWILPFGEWLLAHPPLPEWMTPAVRFFEMLGPLALFAPVSTAGVRLCMIPAFWGLLAGLGLSLELNLFPWIAGIGMLPFLPGSVWDALGRRDALVRAQHSQAAPGPRGIRCAASLAENAIVLALLAIVIWMNAGAADARLALPGALRRVTAGLLLDQSWQMYAPSPRRVDAWFEHEGRLRNGFPVDLDRATGGAGWTAVERAWDDYRFKYYLQKLVHPKWEEVLAAYGQWLCRRWNLDRRGGARLDTVKLSAVITPIVIGNEETEPPEIWELHGAGCPKD